MLCCRHGSVNAFAVKVEAAVGVEDDPLGFVVADKRDLWDLSSRDPVTGARRRPRWCIRPSSTRRLVDPGVHPHRHGPRSAAGHGGVDRATLRGRRIHPDDDAVVGAEESASGLGRIADQPLRASGGVARSLAEPLRTISGSTEFGPDCGQRRQQRV